MIETEIQRIVASHLKNLGYKTWQPESKNHRGPDIVGYHVGLHHLWIVEAKGVIQDSANRRMAFETALGQICQRGTEWKKATGCGVLLPTDIVTYGLAFPEGDDYRYLCRQLRSGVRSALSLYLLLMDNMNDR